MEAYSPDRFRRLSALKPVRRSIVPLAPTEDSQHTDLLASLVGGEIGRNNYGEHMVARHWHGTPEACELGPESLSLLLPPRTPNLAHALQQASDPAKWLFLDTETTGITGGTGTYAFLVGLAWWEAGGLQVEQLFMRDHGEEHSILLELARRMNERPVLVTFNGKSFDWPLLETRFRMTRAIDVPSFSVHLDFLHPARQLWRLRFDSLRLAELERNVLNAKSLGWSRQEDIDSSCIPAFYFDYLRGAGAGNLAGVFRHNRMDLRGLAALAVRILRTFAALDAVPPDDNPQGCELYGISRLLVRRGERQRARAVYERALSAGLPGAIERKARYELARLVRREKDFARASELWQELSQTAGPNHEAWEQLAIHYERRMGNPQEAVRATTSGIAELRRAARLGFISSPRHDCLLERFRNRLARLQGKLCKE